MNKLRQEEEITRSLREPIVSKLELDRLSGITRETDSTALDGRARNLGRDGLADLDGNSHVLGTAVDEGGLGLGSRKNDLFAIDTATAHLNVPTLGASSDDRVSANRLATDARLVYTTKRNLTSVGSH